MAFPKFTLAKDGNVQSGGMYTNQNISHASVMGKDIVLVELQSRCTRTRTRNSKQMSVLSSSETSCSVRIRYIQIRLCMVSGIGVPSGLYTLLALPRSSNGQIPASLLSA